MEISRPKSGGWQVQVKEVFSDEPGTKVDKMGRKEDGCWGAEESGQLDPQIYSPFIVMMNYVKRTIDMNLKNAADRGTIPARETHIAFLIQFVITSPSLDFVVKGLIDAQSVYPHIPRGGCSVRNDEGLQEGGQTAVSGDASLL
jgi:hypothetical protein